MTAFSDTYDVTTPAGSGDPAEADDRMREIKAAVQERENVDHYWEKTGDEVSHADVGEHRKVTLRVGSAPTAVADKGFVYAKDVGGKAELFYRDEDGNEIQLTSKGVNLANDTYLKGANAAGDSSVNLIKAGTNDLPTLPDSAEMASDAAPTENEAIANKKYVDDQVDTTAFGTRTANDDTPAALAINTVYKVTSDGFVTYTVNMGNQDMVYFYTDSSSPPTTLIARTHSDAGNVWQGVCVPVKKNEYWKITYSGAGSVANIKWLPIGSGVCQDQS